ncbi:MAG TPA: hypothetical protein VIL71_22680 [Spirillospora sp.]
MSGDDPSSGVETRGPGPQAEGTSARTKREPRVGMYARRAMVSSAQAHERAAALLEQMARAHPEEAEMHRQSALRHRRWAENDRELAEKYAPRGDPDSS